MNEMLNIPLSKIRQNKVALRDVNRQGESFLELVASVRTQGVLSAISVRRKLDKDDDKEYELVDGLQRFTASLEVGTGVVDRVAGADGQTNSVGQFLTIDGKSVGVIPAQVLTRDEADTLVAQVIGNAHRVETKPTEYSDALTRILGYNPAMTSTELAFKLGKSPEWIGKILTLKKLAETIKPLVDEGAIPLINAINLAKLPLEEQLEWVERAQTLRGDEFAAACAKRAKEIRDAHKKGVEAPAESFTATRHFRKKPEIEAEADKPTVLPALIRDAELTKGLKKDAAGLEEAAHRGAVFALNWAMNFDPKSQQEQADKDAARRQAAKDLAARRNAEKTAKKEEEARKRAAEASEEAAKAKAAAANLPPAPAPVAKVEKPLSLIAQAELDREKAAAPATV
jgi:ParB-like chromosome segregation protein Spo0J